MDSPFSDKIGSLILKAYKGNSYNWRTIWGLSRSTGLSEEKIKKYLEEHPELFRKSLISPSGSDLYALSKIAVKKILKREYARE